MSRFKLVQKICLTEGEYAEARQFFSSQEIRVILYEEGMEGLRAKIARAVKATERSE